MSSGNLALPSFTDLAYRFRSRQVLFKVLLLGFLLVGTLAALIRSPQPAGAAIPHQTSAAPVQFESVAVSSVYEPLNIHLGPSLDSGVMRQVHFGSYMLWSGEQKGRYGRVYIITAAGHGFFGWVFLPALRFVHQTMVSQPAIICTTIGCVGSTNVVQTVQPGTILTAVNGAGRIAGYVEGLCPDCHAIWRVQTPSGFAGWITTTAVERSAGQVGTPIGAGGGGAALQLLSVGLNPSVQSAGIILIPDQVTITVQTTNTAIVKIYLINALGSPVPGSLLFQSVRTPTNAVQSWQFSWNVPLSFTDGQLRVVAVNALGRSEQRIAIAH